MRAYPSLLLLVVAITYLSTIQASTSSSASRSRIALLHGRRAVQQAKMVGRGRHLCNRGKDLERPVAAVYRGPIACDGCSESVAELLRKSPANFRVHYLGPTETHDINAHTLSHLDLFAWPGGGGEHFESPPLPYFHICRLATMSKC